MHFCLHHFWRVDRFSKFWVPHGARLTRILLGSLAWSALGGEGRFDMTWADQKRFTSMRPRQRFWRLQVTDLLCVSGPRSTMRVIARGPTKWHRVTPLGRALLPIPWFLQPKTTTSAVWHGFRPFCLQATDSGAALFPTSGETGPLLGAKVFTWPVYACRL